MTVDNRLAVLSLIACDDAYQPGDWTVGDPLRTYPDSKAINGDLEPDPIPEHLMRDAGLRFEYMFKGAYHIAGWKVAGSVSDDETGFGVVIFQNDAKTEAIVAFTGTNGLTPQGLQGWFTDLTLARTQWNDENQRRVLQAIRNLRGPNNNDFIGVLNFTGQSLGGALAQYALYDYSNSIPEFDASRATLTTFNGLGAIDALSRRRDYETVSERLRDVKTAHFSIYNDIVHRLGGGNVNAAENTYQFKFTRTVPGLEYFALDGTSVQGPERQVANSFIDAHRIEDGFYRGLTRQNVDFRAAELYTPKLISGEASRSIADGFGNLLNDRDHSPGESVARIVAGVAASLATNPAASKEIAFELCHAVKLQAESELGSATWSFFESTVPAVLQVAEILPVLRPQLMGVAAFGLVIASTVDLFETVGTSAADLREYLRGVLDEARAFSPANVADFDVANGLIDDSGLLAQRAKAAAALAIATGTLPGLSAQLAIAIANDPRAAFQSLQSENWVGDFFKYVADKVQEIESNSGASVEETQRALGYALGGVSKGIYALGLGVPRTSNGAEVALQSWTQTIGDGVEGVLKAAANAYDDFTAKYRDPLLVWPTSLPRSAVDAIKRGFESAVDTVVNNPLARIGVSSARDSKLVERLERSEDLLTRSAQTVVMLPERAANPFDDDHFDPDASPLAIGELREGSVQTFTAYLPYEAGLGGQKIKFRLTGAAASNVTVLDKGVELGADGTFTLTVPEGQRELSFGMAALEDVDTDATLTLSATLIALVDGVELPTHLTHEEASIALDGEVETPPSGGREIRGDWSPKPYTDPLSGNTYYAYDDLRNIERLPGALNTTGFQEPDGSLDGSPGSDHIVTGDYEEQVYGYEGDDAIIGSELRGSVFFGGAGNDWIEALGYTQHAQDYFEFTLQGRTVRLGEDKIYGGAGDDRIYGESEAAVNALYDPSVTPTGLTGDWLSGGTGNDYVFGGSGDDVLMGGAGEDQLVGGAGMDVLLGDDHFHLRPEGNFWRVIHPVFGDLTTGYGQFEVGLFPVVNADLAYPDYVWDVNGDPDFVYYKNGGADVLIGGAGKDILIGQIGDDVLYGGEDADILAGWEDDDQLYGGEGDDLMAGDFGRYEQVDERLFDANQPMVARVGVVGSQSYIGAPVGQMGDDLLDGGAGNDQLWGEGGNDAVLGGEGNDTLYGDATYLPEELHGADIIDGGTGADQLYGGGRDDKLYGGAGDDNLFGGSDNDLLDGGPGNDLLAGEGGDDLLQGGEGADVLTGGEGQDVLRGGGADDTLAGDEGNDTLYGDAGADQLDGESGDDHIYGGAGADVISGGAGDDFIDGGAGVDLLQGGAGNDTYAAGFGYGADVIEDMEGENRIRFGSGIAPEDLRAQMDQGTLAATLTLGLAGDSLTFNAAHMVVGGVEFANGVVWTKADFAAFMPARVAQGSNAGEVLSGNGRLRNDLQGRGGDDVLEGAQFGDSLAGGQGNDSLEGEAGSDRYLFDAHEIGVDSISDSGLAARAYLDWFYGSRGIANWEERAEHGGQYRAQLSADGNGFVAYFEGYDDAYGQYPDATISFLEPLAETAPLVTRNDTAILDELSGAGLLDRDVVTFGPGVSLADLQITITVTGALADEHPEQPWNGGGTLSVRWGEAGFDLQVPDAKYGFVGSNLLTDGVQGAENAMPGSWRGYRLGEGVEALQFADGSAYTLEQVLQRADVVRLRNYEFLRGSGLQIVDPLAYNGIAFDASISSSQLEVTRDASDLVVSLTGDSAAVRVERWFAEPGTIPDVSLRFASEPPIASAELTRVALTQRGTEADDYLVAADGFPNALYGEDGFDVLQGSTGDDLLDGGASDDQLWAYGGNDSIFGGPGADFILGGDGDDVLDGGAGQDNLTGGAGDDRYVFGHGYGEDTAADDADHDGSGYDTVRFLPDVSPADLSAEHGGYGRVILRLNGGDDALWLLNWPNEPGGSIERFQFADGTMWGAADIDAMLPVSQPTGEADSIFGTTGDDDLGGLAGADEIYGYAGDDVIEGGAGDDYVEGGQGNDTYVFNAGDGFDGIWDSGGNDTLRFGAGIAAASVTLTTDPYSLYLGIGPTGDSVAIYDWFYDEVTRIERIAFADGTIWNAAAIEARLNGGGSPEIASPISDQTATEDAAFTFTVPENAFAGDSLVYSASLADDSVLPTWLSFDPTTQTFSGTPFNANVGVIDVTVTATNSADASVSDTFTVTVVNTNDAPAVASASADQTAAEDDLFSFTLPAYTFDDVDAGDELTYIASRSEGKALPTWLSFNPQTGTFSGRPLQADVGPLDIRITATDVGGLSVSDDFTLTVVNINDAPATANAIADQTATEDEAFDFTIPETVFADEDPGETLAYAATLSDGAALPAWLSFDAGRRALFGTPANPDVGELEVKLTATDAAGASVSDSFTLTIANVNDAPTLEFALADAQAIEDQPFALAIPAGTFSDVDAEDVLALSASLASGAPLPEWLSYDAASGMLSGTPENAHVGDLDIRVTATDAGGASTSDTFTVAVVNINDAPIVANPVADQTATEDSAFAYTVPENTFSDEDRGDALTWFASRADGSELPAWLSFDGFNRAFSGAPANEDVGSVEVRVAVHDGAGEAVADTFRIEVANVNDAPKLQTPLSDLHTTEDQAFTFALPAETFSDVDKGDTLTYTAARADGTLLPAWLQFADGTFSGTPRNPDVGSYDFRVSAADSARVVVSDLFRLDVANVNDAPTVANPLDDRSFEAGSAFSFTVPANTFADEDVGDALTLTAGLYGGAALPSWLQFDPATGTFTGNPGKKENGILRVVLTAADLAGAAASTDFGLVVRAKSGSTVTGGKGDDVMYGGTGNETLIAKGGNDALFGGEGNDMMSGGNGEDLLQGGEGADMLHGGSGNNLLDGGSGDDVIFGGRGASLIAGGTGNDLIRTGSGSDVILFNRGDGIDTVFSDRAGDNTLSFGGGIRYSDLRLSKTGKDLVVDAGADDRIVLKDWYNGKRSVLNLQIVAEASADFDADSADPLRNRRVQTFDFLGLVSSFDQARKASPGLTSWDLTNALLQFHLSGADDMALGGDLAYWYAKNRGFGGVSLAAAQQVLGAASFGSEAQALRPFNGLQEGFVKLS